MLDNNNLVGNLPSQFGDGLPFLSRLYAPLTFPPALHTAPCRPGRLLAAT